VTNQPAPLSDQSAIRDPQSAVAPPRLRRVLGLWDLIFYGVVLIQPVGAVGIFGLADKNSFGHVTATILIALVAMMLTAVSYGRMAGLYPAAGSAYTYVGRGLNVHAGFMAGWAMFLDYLVIPIVSVVYGALSTQKFIDDLAPAFSKHLVTALGLSADPQKVGFYFWVILFTVLITVLNVRGIKWTASANLIMTAIMFLVVAIFVVEALAWVMNHHGASGLFSLDPIYKPQTFSLRAVGTATSLAALTYIGFDGITTLAEDVREPKRTVPIAVVLVCLVIGICATLQVYLAQLVWPDFNSFKDPDTAFFDVCSVVGGKFLLDSFTLVMAIACIGSALTGQVGAARILFGMGRDKALPSFFARLNAGGNPVRNIWILGGLLLIGALALNYEQAANLVNFGAFIAFMGVNLAVTREFCFRRPEGHRRNWLLDMVLPGLGFAFCLWLWCRLPVPAMIVGGIWCAVGLIYTGIMTRGFRKPPVMINLEG